MSTPINELHTQIEKAMNETAIEQFLKGIPFSFGPFVFDQADQFSGGYYACFYSPDAPDLELEMILPHNQNYLVIVIKEIDSGSELAADQIKSQSDFANLEDKWKCYWS